MKKQISKSFTPERRNFLIVTLLSLCLGIGFSACFTGVESTKKINLTREERRLANPTKEERFMQQVEASPLKEWETGKRFIVSDNKALLVIVPQEGLSPLIPDSIQGEVFEFAGVESKMNAAGKIDLALTFTDGTYLYAYDTGKDFSDAMENMKSDQIPMLIDEDMVTQAKTLLTGQKLWTRSPLWYDGKGNRIDGKKFVEVTVVDVKPGDMVFPLMVEFREDGTGDTAYVFMNFGSADNESRSFHNLFSLSDIKKHYPSIEPETWKYISESRVKTGMTKEEVKLALGNPTDIRSGHDYSQTLDIWTYDNGKVLWFEDGQLTKIRQ